MVKDRNFPKKTRKTMKIMMIHPILPTCSPNMQIILHIMISGLNVLTDKHLEHKNNEDYDDSPNFTNMFT